MTQRTDGYIPPIGDDALIKLGQFFVLALVERS
jgi:hypothetical protein